MNPPTHMLAARNTSFGPPEVVSLQSIATPRPGKGEVLVRVHAATVSTGDCRLRSKNVPRGFGVIMGLLFGFSRPKYRSLGTDLAGEIVECGPEVKSFKVGDRVVANLGMKLGGHAEYAVVSASSAIARVPDAVSHETAAALVFGGTTALVFLRDKLHLKKGDRLLVIGGGGAVGSAAVQLGRELGAHVTAVCSGEKAAVVTALGAERVIDYKTQDWDSRSDTPYDVILDTVGGMDLGRARGVLTPNGRIGLVVADLPLMLKSAWISMIQSQKLVAGPISENASDLTYLLELCEKGKFKPLIGDVFPFSKIVEAHKKVDSGHKTGSVVLRIQE